MADRNKEQTREQKPGNALQQKGRGGRATQTHRALRTPEDLETSDKEHHPRRPGQEQLKAPASTTQTIGPGHPFGPNLFSSAPPSKNRDPLESAPLFTKE